MQSSDMRAPTQTQKNDEYIKGERFDNLIFNYCNIYTIKKYILSKEKHMNALFGGQFFTHRGQKRNVK